MKQDKRPHNKEVAIKIYEHVPLIDPKDYNITDIEKIDPLYYFTTSGEAIWKATYMEKVFWAAAGRATKLYGKSKNKKHKEYCSKMWAAAGAARKLLNLLKEIKDDSIFLETEWRDRDLYVIPKNPKTDI